MQATTDAGVPAVGDQEVMNALQAKCSTCHSGWFQSLNAFQSLVKNSAKLVTPGDPDGSLLILFMEENGPGLGQMPPGFTGNGDSFMDMSNKGETSVTLQEIRDWISAM